MTVSITLCPSFGPARYSSKHRVVIYACSASKCFTLMNSCPLRRHRAGAPPRRISPFPFPSAVSRRRRPNCACQSPICLDTSNWIPPSSAAAVQTLDRRHPTGNCSQFVVAVMFICSNFTDSYLTLWNRADHYIFILSFVLLSSSSSFPRLISAVAEWMSAILAHMVWP